MSYKRQKLLSPLLASSLITISTLLGGCAVDESLVLEEQQQSRIADSQEAQVRREQQFRAEWEGKSYKTLVEKRGVPSLTMHVTRKGGPPSTGFVYQSDDGSGCVDAFVVLQGEGTIVDYFCR